jgi:hypothetical protein
VKRVTLGALAFAALLGFGSVHGLADVLAPQDVDLSRVELPEGYREALKAAALAQLSAYEAMRGSRTLLLIGLWAMSAFVFVAALRMLRPRGALRDGVRKVLGSALLITAVLRTLEGAQSAAVARKAGRALDRALTERPDLIQPLFSSEQAALVLSVAFSFVVTGGLLLLSRYFRSPRVGEVCAGLDAGSGQ